VPKYKLLVGRFPYGNREDSRCVDWLVRASVQLSHDKRFDVCMAKIADTPITMTRNQMIEYALKREVDILLMIDSDIEPDCELGEDMDAKPFLDTSLEFLLDHHGPCIVGAPYCGPPPFENVYVFQWGDKMSEDPDGFGSLNQFTRENAAMMTGITEVAALPTGLMLLDMRAFKEIPPPYTYYEWQDEGPPCPHCGVRKPGPQSAKASTEDVTLTRDLRIAGVRQYCNWDAWAAHIKDKRVRKPRPLTTDIVADRMKKACVSGLHSLERLRTVEPPKRTETERAADKAKEELTPIACGHRLNPWPTREMAAERGKPGDWFRNPDRSKEQIPLHGPPATVAAPPLNTVAATVLATDAQPPHYDLADIARRFPGSAEPPPAPVTTVAGGMEINPAAIPATGPVAALLRQTMQRMDEEPADPIAELAGQIQAAIPATAEPPRPPAPPEPAGAPLSLADMLGTM
jgi:hypothetical protein